MSIYRSRDGEDRVEVVSSFSAYLDDDGLWRDGETHEPLEREQQEHMQVAIPGWILQAIWGEETE